MPTPVRARSVSKLAQTLATAVGQHLRGKEDALSTFGSFTSDNSAGVNPVVKLGVFFATGVAAQNLAEGFACAIATNPPGWCAEKKSQ